MALLGAFNFQYRFWELCNNPAVGERFFNEISKAAMKMGQDMAQANIFTGLTGPAPPPKPVHVVLEEAYRTIWLDRRVQEGEAAIAHMVNDETLAAHSPLLHLRAQLLHAEAQLVRVMMHRCRADIKDCIERYGTLHRTVKRLCREGPAAVEAEARVCEAEALAVRGALYLALGEVLQGHSHLRRAHVKYQALWRQAKDDDSRASMAVPPPAAAAAATGSKAVQPAAASTPSTAAQEKVSMDPRAALAAELRAMIEEKTSFIRGHELDRFETNNTTYSCEVLQATEELITLKLYLKDLTGTWISSDRQQRAEAAAAAARKVVTEARRMRRSASSACLEQKQQEEDEDEMEDDAGPQPSGTADVPAAPPCTTEADSVVWALRPRVAFGIHMFQVAPVILPKTLRWAWRFIATEGGKKAGGGGRGSIRMSAVVPSTLQELEMQGQQGDEKDWRRGLDDVSQARSLRSPLAALVLSRLPATTPAAAPQLSSSSSSSMSSVSSVHEDFVAMMNTAGAEISKFFWQPWTTTSAAAAEAEPSAGELKKDMSGVMVV